MNTYLRLHFVKYYHQLFLLFIGSLVTFTLLPSAFAAPSDDFVFTVKTDIVTIGDNSFELPLTGTGYNFNVDCDDDGLALVNVTSSTYNCTYATAGTYTIRIVDTSGNNTGFPRFKFKNGDDAKLISHDQWGTSKWETMDNAFFSTENLTTTATDIPNFANVTSFASMFFGATISTPTTTGWDTSAATTMHSMFYNAANANPDTSGWNTANVDNMTSMFRNAKLANPNTTTAGDVWNTGLVRNMTTMFDGASIANPDTSGWDTSSVINMFSMFGSALIANPDTSAWDTSKVTDMTSLFNNAPEAMPDTSGWNTENVTTMKQMFRDASKANPDTSSWNTANVTSMNSMFFGATSAQPITTTNGNIWNTNNVTSMALMFSGASIATPDTSGWIIDNISSLRDMFKDTLLANPDTSNWDTANINDMQYMFSGASNAQPDTSNWDTSQVTNMLQMFKNAVLANPDTSIWDVGNVTTMHDMFRNAYAAKPDVSSWDTSSVVSTTNMFYMAGANVINPDMSNWALSQTSSASLEFILVGAKLTTQNYDKLLIALKTSVDLSAFNRDFNAGSSNYCIAKVQRETLDPSDSWNITDGGYDCSSVAPDLVNLSDSGISKIDDRTSISASIFSVYCPANLATTTLYSDLPSANTVIGTYACTTEEYVDITAAALGDATHTITFTTTPNAGTESAHSPALSVTIDSTMADLRTPNLLPTSDAGTSNTDNLTNLTSLDFAVYCPTASSDLRLMYNDGGSDTEIANLTCSTIGWTTIANTATWPDGDLTVTVIELNGSLVEIAHSLPLALKIDISLPSITVLVDKLTSASGNASTSLVTGQVIGVFTAVILVEVEVDTFTYSGTINSDGKFTIEVPQASLNNDSSVDVSITITDSFNQSVTGMTTLTVINETDAFIFTVNTNINSDNSTTFILPLDGTDYNFEVICDSTLPAVTFNYGSNANTCTYGSAGEYTIIIRDLSGTKTGFERFKFLNGDEHKLISHDQWGTSIWDTMSEAFSRTSNLLTTGLDIPDFTNVQNMYAMFFQVSLANPSTTYWVTGTITNMSEMFSGASVATPDTTSWDTVNVTDMYHMFSGATNANPDTSTWNTANVTDMQYMFYLAENAQPVTATSGNIWNTSNVSTMASMFRGAKLANPDTSGWNTSNVTTMSDMFAEATNADPDTSGWNTAKVTQMQNMFFNAPNATPVTTTSGIIWNTANVTNMHEMFRGATSAKPNTSGWNTANVTDMVAMFLDATSANPVVTNWDIANVTDMTDMFDGVKLPTQSYDIMLQHWQGQTVNSAITFDGGLSNYCLAQSERDAMTSASTNTWIITDSGQDCSSLAPDLIDSSDSGALNTDDITNISTPTFSVYCPASGATVTLYSNLPSANTTIGTYACIAQAYVEITASTLSDAIHTVTFTTTVASVESAPYGSLAVEIDSSLPDFPSLSVTINKLTSTSGNTGTSLVTGQATGDFTTGDSIEIVVNSVTYTSTVDSEGKYAIEVVQTDLDADSSVDVSMTITDAFGQSVTDNVTLNVIDETDAFIFTIKTDIVTSGEKAFMLPLTGGGYNFEVICDSTLPAVTFNNGSNADTCTYGTAGEYTIIIRDLSSSKTGFPRFSFNNGDAHKLISHDQWGTSKWDDMSEAFRETTNLLTTGLDSPNFSNVISMSSMFSGASLVNPTTTNWDTSNIIEMTRAFYYARLATPDTSNWDTANVTDMSYMFASATNADPDTSAWDTAKVEYMEYMFYLIEFGNPITSTSGNIWNTSKVRNMINMFGGARVATPDTSGWDTGEVESMKGIFYNAYKATPNTSGWDTSKVTDMEGMFGQAYEANPDTSGWNTINVEYMNCMFCNASAANPDTSNWNTAKVKDMREMFQDANVANPDTSGWNTEKVQDLSYMFDNASLAKPNTSGWNTSSVVDMNHMFSLATVADPVVTSWNISNVTDMTDMFDGVKLPTASYDTMLKHWEGQLVNSAVVFGGGLSNFCLAGTEWASLDTASSWTITDAGQNCATVAPDLIDSSDSGASNTDNTTNVPTPIFSVYCPANNATVILYSNLPSTNTAVGSYACTAEEYVEITANTLSDATHTITFTTTVASVESAAYGSLAVEIDSSLLDWPSLSVTLDRLTSASGNAGTSLVTGQVIGDFTTGDSISIVVNGVTYIDTVDSEGKYAVEVSQTELDTDSSVYVSMTITDSFGQSVTDSATVNIIDETDAFIFTIHTDIAIANNKEFTLPLNGSGYNFMVDCGDGSTLVNITSTPYTCVYATAGTYTVLIHDNVGNNTGFPRFKFALGDSSQLISLDQWGTSKWDSMEKAFNYTNNLLATPLDIPDFSNVQSMQRMFYKASLVNPSTTHWDTSNVTDMSELFHDASEAAPDTTNWNTANVTTMSHMFSGANNAAPDTSSWNTANVTNMYSMFMNASNATPDTSTWNTANVIEMSYMFRGAINATPDTSAWNTVSIISMRSMFYGATNADPDTSAWNTANVTNMSRMFATATNANPIVTSWDIGNVTNMTDMFDGVKLPTANYDTMLKHWEGQLVNSAVVFGGGLSNYCTAKPAHDELESILTNNWAITDAGQDCSTLLPANAPDLTAGSDLGVSNSDDITSLTTPSFGINCPTDSAIIKLYSDQPSSNTEIASYTCTAVGVVNIAVSTLALGVHNIKYTQTIDASISGDSPTLAVTIEPLVVAIPTITIVTNSALLITGQSSVISFNFSEAVTGFSASDISVTNGNLSNLVKTVGQNQWTATFTPLVNIEGDVDITVTTGSYASSGGTLGQGYQLTFVIDTLAPATQITVNDIDLNAVFDHVQGPSLAVTGKITGDFTTGDIITLTINNQTYTGAVDSQGNYNIAVLLSDLSASENILASITTTDSSGNNFTGSIVKSNSQNINAVPIANSQAINTAINTAVAITLTASDSDNDVLTYTITQSPTNGVLTGSGESLTYTPNADFQGVDSFNFTATDPFQGSSEETITITVAATVVNMLAVDDFFTITSSQVVILDVLANDQFDNSFTIELQAATAFGQLLIIDNKIEYTPAQDLTGDIQISYSIASNGNKSSAIATVSFPNDLAPNITVPADLCDELSVNSNALYTKVNLGEATAVDSFGNSLPVSLVDGNLLYPAGINKAYWQAIDNEGVKSIKAQNVCVYPLVSLHKDQVIERGATMQVGVYLNGESPIYPLIIPYEVSSGNSKQMQPLTTGNIVIEQGTDSVINLDSLLADLLSEDDRLRIDLANNINFGSINSHLIRFTTVSTATEPDIIFNVKQNNQNRYTLAKEQQVATITTTIGNMNESQNEPKNHAITWMYNEQEIENLSEVTNEIEFQLSDFSLGLATLSAVITDKNGEILHNHSDIDVEIIQQFAQLTNIDSDGDLISDIEEGFQDNDNDFIPDYLDRIDECNVLQQNNNEFDAYLIESNVGFCLRRGKLTIGNTGGGAQLTSVDIQRSQTDTLTRDPEATNVGGIFDFVAQGSITPESSFAIVIPQRKPIPIAAIYRNLLANGQWQDFVEDGNNSLWSTAGEPGYCPPPNTNADATNPWDPGLIEGYWCVQLIIEDGGNNDEDKQINGRIINLGGVGVQNNSNHLPIAVDDVAQLNQHSEVTIEVLMNDTDADNDPLTITSAAVNIGTVNFDDSQVYYQGNENYAGDITIHYGISDGNGGTDIGTAIVSAYVNTPPIVVNDQASTDNATAITVDVLANDSDNVAGILQLLILSTTSGVVKVVDEQVLFTPDATFVGIVTVVYQVTDPEGASANGELKINVSEAQTSASVKHTHGGASETLLLLLFLMTWLRLLLIKRHPVR